MELEVVCREKVKKMLSFIALLALLTAAACSRHPVYPEPVRTASEVEIGMKALTEGSPQFFTYHFQDKDINFFVIKTGGKVLSFFDACAKCYPKKLGYRIDNGYIVCKSCNVRYSVAEIEKGIGSCFPIQIPGQLDGNIQDGKYRIAVAELEKAAYRF
ncbi:MAG TPA: Fe-S-containing protein [Dissulfurispiraceae bacterium]